MDKEVAAVAGLQEAGVIHSFGKGGGKKNYRSHRTQENGTTFGTMILHRPAGRRGTKGSFVGGRNQHATPHGTRSTASHTGKNQGLFLNELRGKRSNRCRLEA